MWEVDNKTPFEASGYFARDKYGTEHWCVAVRGLFEVLPDGLVSIAELQKPVRLAPIYSGKNAEELVAEADFMPFRPQADILVMGKAIAQGGKAFRRQAVRFSCGAISKEVMALAPRRIVKQRRRWELSEQEEVDSVDLSWRMAVGGVDLLASEEAPPLHDGNPIGRGWSLNFHNAPNGTEFDLAQIENPTDMLDPNETNALAPRPVCFAPIQRSWPARYQYAGTYDETWENGRSPLLPEDFSERFYQAAPPDQIYSDEFRGGVPVYIEGMHIDGSYTFRLPQVILEAATWLGRSVSIDRFRITSVTLFGTEKRLEVVWNMSVPCNGQDMQLDKSVVRLRQMSGVAHKAFI
jgi:hypothetical protein